MHFFKLLACTISFLTICQVSPSTSLASKTA
nr:MAG TPA: hypothetical protein [Caudoviricetes sp.]